MKTVNLDIESDSSRQEYMSVMWDDLAPMAYEGYLQRGRGMFVVQGDGRIGWAVPRPEAPAGILELVGQYDPDMEIVFCFDGRESYYTYKQRAEREAYSPREMYFASRSAAAGNVADIKM